MRKLLLSLALLLPIKVIAQNGSNITYRPFVSGSSGGGGFSSTTTVNAGQIINGPLASSVLPSTVAYTSVDNNFSATQTFQSTVTINGQDGSGFSLKLSSGISMAGGTVNAGMFIGNGALLTNLPNIPAANILSGTLGAQVIASSVAATGVGGPNTCGSATISCSFDVQPDGRITRLSSATISGGSGMTALTGDGAAAGPGSQVIGVSSASAANGFFVTNQETVGSTFTVIGNAMSIGGSSFTVAGGSATVAFQAQAGSFLTLGISSAAVFVSTGLGTATNPVFQTMVGGSKSGLYFTTNPGIGLSVSGTARLFVDSGGIYTCSSAGCGQISYTASRVSTVPQLSFHSDLTTGFGWTAQSTFTAVSNGVIIATFSQAGVVFTPRLSSGTVSAALSGTFTNTTLGPCIASSTGSMNLQPGISEIRFDLHGTASVASLSAVITFGVLVDGAFVDGETSSVGATAPLEPVSTDGTNVGFTIYASGLASGVHNYCLTASVSTGTGTIDSTNSVMHLHAHLTP